MNCNCIFFLVLTIFSSVFLPVSAQETDTILARLQKIEEKISAQQATIQQQQAAIVALNNKVANLESENNHLKDRVLSIETNGVEWANKARMLQARDTYHFMRFQKVNTANNDVFSLWRTDNVWFELIKVNAADYATNGGVKNVKFFGVEAGVDTQEAYASTEITFPESVDCVALESLQHDCHDMFWCRPVRLDDKRFRIDFRNARGQGNRIIMGVKFVGIQVVR